MRYPFGYSVGFAAKEETHYERFLYASTLYGTGFSGKPGNNHMAGRMPQQFTAGSQPVGHL